MNWIEWETAAVEKVEQMREEARVANLVYKSVSERLARGLVWLAQKLDKQMKVVEFRELQNR